MWQEQALNGHSGPTCQRMPRGSVSLLTILTTILRTAFKTYCPLEVNPEECHFSEVSGIRCSQLPSGLSLPHSSHDNTEENPLCSGSQEAMLLLCKLVKAGDETACEGGPNHDTAQV